MLLRRLQELLAAIYDVPIDCEVRDFVTNFMAQTTQGHWGRVREEKDVAEWFEGLEILEPGLVEVSTWRPDSEVAPRQLTHEWIEFGGVARLV